jgi:tetratricopeptide (TPR) repeat protein
MKNYFLFIFLFSFNFCVSTGEKTLEGNGAIDKLEIRGFKQFPIYTARNFLGYIKAESQENTFDKKLWRGKVKEDSIKQNLNISYSLEDLKELKAGFKEILSAEGSLQNIKSVNLTLENPVQYILEEISIEPDFKTQKELFNNSYIGAVLKVDRIKIEFTNEQGITLKTEADLKLNSIKLGANIKTNSKENSMFFAENAFVGYKLFDAPQNPESLITEEDKRMKVVVLPFELEGIKPKEERLKSALADATSRALNSVDSIFVLDRNSYQKILEEQKTIKSENFDSKNAIRIGKLMTANTIVIGKFSREGLEARISCQMIDVETNAVLQNGQIKLDLNLKGKTTPAIADEWEDKILVSFGLPVSKKESSVLGTNKTEAYDYYRKGRENFILLDEESLELAIPDFIKATELDPQYSDAFASLSESYQRLYDYRIFRGDRIGAEKMKLFGFEAATKSFELTPNSTLSNRVLSLYYFYLDPDFLKSKKFANKAVELDPKDAEAAIRQFIVKSRENKKIISSLNKDLLSIYDMNPNLISTNFYMASVYKLEKKYDKAHEIYKKVLEISPKNLAAYSEISNLYMEEGKWSEAIAILDTADEIYPNHFQIQILYANLFLKKRDYKKSLEYIVIARTLQPKSTIPLELLANISVKEKKYEEAISLYQKCIELEPKKALFQNYLGGVYKLKNNIPSAINSYKQASQLEPKNTLSYENLGDVYILQSKIDEAIPYFEKCVELNPNAYFYRILGDALMLKPNPDLAIQNYYKALEQDTEEFMIYNEIGFALVLKKDFPKATENFSKAIEKGNTEAKSYGNKGLGDILRRQKSFDAAIEMYKKAYSLDPTNYDSQIEMANSYSKKNNLNEAVLVLKSVLEKDIENARAHFGLGKYYRDLSREPESKLSFKKSCDLGYKKGCDEVYGTVKRKKKILE